MSEHARLERNETSRSQANVDFGTVMQRWLRTHGYRGSGGVIIVSMEDDGFALLQLGPVTLSMGEMFDYLRWVVEQAEDAV